MSGGGGGGGGGRDARIADDVSSELEVRPVLGPAGNTRSSLPTRKPLSKSKPYLDKTTLVTPPDEKDLVAAAAAIATHKEKKTSSSQFRSPTTTTAPWTRRDRYQLLHSNPNLSLNASCSSDVSSDSLRSRASTGKITRSTATGIRTRRPKQCVSKSSDKTVSDTDSAASSFDTTTTSHSHFTQKRCAWVTPNTDPCYAAFHDEEWGVPVHDDKKLFELLVFSGALAELTWPSILMKRHIFREVFADFDPVSVSKMNEKKITAPGSTASFLLSELKLRAIIENARQITKIINEFGSFDKYIWSFVNYKPIVNRFRYPRQVPAKTSKADVISKELLKRGLRSVSATVIYSFMQVSGITNDHLITCFKYQECTNLEVEEDGSKVKDEEKPNLGELSFPPEGAKA